MKRFKRLGVVFVASLLLLSAVLFCACDNKNNSISISYPNAKAYTVAGSGELSAMPAYLKLDIEWINGAVTVKSDPNATTVSFSEVAEGEELTDLTTMHYLMDGNVLRIRYAASGKIKIGNLKKQLSVKVPANTYLTEVDVQAVSANVTVEGINSAEVDCETVSGAVTVNCTAREVNVESVSGSVSVKGDILHVDTENVSGTTTVTGNRNMVSLDAESTSGDITLLLVGDAGFTLEYETLSGVLINAFRDDMLRQGKRYVYLTGGCQIEVDTTSAKLTIERI